MIGKKHGKWPVNIDTLAKTAWLHFSILFVLTGLFYVLFLALDISNQTLLVLGLLILVFNYCSTTFLVDRFHGEIGGLIKGAKKDQKTR